MTRTLKECVRRTSGLSVSIQVTSVWRISDSRGVWSEEDGRSQSAGQSSTWVRLWSNFLMNVIDFIWVVLVCLEQHQSPSCVLFTLYSVDPVLNVMHFIDLGSQKKTWSQNIYSAFSFDVQIFFVHVIPFFFLSDGDQPFLLFCVWTAPEVLSGGPYNHAADWWSLGIMLFSLAEGEVMTRRLNMFELVCVS